MGHVWGGCQVVRLGLWRGAMRDAAATLGGIAPCTVLCRAVQFCKWLRRKGLMCAQGTKCIFDFGAETVQKRCNFAATFDRGSFGAKSRRDKSARQVARMATKRREETRGRGKLRRDVATLSAGRELHRLGAVQFCKLLGRRG